MFGAQLPDCSKLATNRKNDNEVTVCRHDVIAKLPPFSPTSLGLRQVLLDVSVNLDYGEKYITDRLEEICSQKTVSVEVVIYFLFNNYS